MQDLEDGVCVAGTLCVVGVMALRGFRLAGWELGAALAALAVFALVLGTAGRAREAFLVDVGERITSAVMPGLDRVLTTMRGDPVPGDGDPAWEMTALEADHLTGAGVAPGAVDATKLRYKRAAYFICKAGTYSAQDGAWLARVLGIPEPKVQDPEERKRAMEDDGGDGAQNEEEAEEAKGA